MTTQASPVQEQHSELPLADLPLRVDALVIEPSNLSLPEWTGDTTQPAYAGKTFKRRGIISRLVKKKETEAEKYGLLPRATAIVLRAWDGEMESDVKGLPLSLGDSVTIGRVVNEHWFQGYTTPDKVGYIPRSFVRIEKVLNENIREQLGKDAPPRDRKSISMPSFSLNMLPGKKQGVDKTFSRNRVSLVFSPLPSPEGADQFTTNIVLSLLAAPASRISTVFLTVKFTDGEIIALSPSSIKLDPNQIQHANTNAVNLSANLGSAPTLPAQLTLGTTVSRNNERTFNRQTWGRIQATGTGFSTAEWVFEEDSSEAGRHGVLDHTSELLSITTSVRPALLEYEIEVTAVEGDGEESNWLNTKKHNSGPQRIVLP
jgi:hypothetical protein